MSPNLDRSPPRPASDSKPSVKPNLFRFKSKQPRSPSTSTTPHPSKHPRRHHRRHHTRDRPRSASRTPPLDPEIAFRESLFDALADDEGAAFWEGVYGQPIHTYSPYRLSETLPSADSPNVGPELERMTDEEYAKYVRAKMWEKSYGYIAEERAKREAERGEKKRKREDGRTGQGGGEAWREREAWQSMVDESLGRREQEMVRETWRRAWEAYAKGWEELRRRAEETVSLEDLANGSTTGTGTKGKMKGWKASMLVWPTMSGKLRDVDAEAVKEFLRNAPKEEHSVDLLAVLKMERVRWHPDKIQQRYGSLGIDDVTKKGVTAVFQIIDRMWGDLKEKATL